LLFGARLLLPLLHKQLRRRREQGQGRLEKGEVGGDNWEQFLSQQN
jgi:hypothetical protein